MPSPRVSLRSNPTTAQVWTILAAGFFALGLREARLYRRAAGYFSSMALLTWAVALPRLVQGNDLKVRLIAAPELSPQDIAVIRELVAEEKRSEYRRMLVERMLDEVIALTENPTDDGVRARIFAWLVANGRLDIRFAFAKHIEAAGIFHEKMGVFDFPGGAQVAFTGSANETLGGHRLNYESIDVYRSWVAGDAERVGTKVAQFDEAWGERCRRTRRRETDCPNSRQAAGKGTAEAAAPTQFRSWGRRTSWAVAPSGRSYARIPGEAGRCPRNGDRDGQDPDYIEDSSTLDRCGESEGGGRRDGRY